MKRSKNETKRQFVVFLLSCYPLIMIVVDKLLDIYCLCIFASQVANDRNVTHLLQLIDWFRDRYIEADGLIVPHDFTSMLKFFFKSMNLFDSLSLFNHQGRG